MNSRDEDIKAFIDEHVQPLIDEHVKSLINEVLEANHRIHELARENIKLTLINQGLKAQRDAQHKYIAELEKQLEPSVIEEIREELSQQEAKERPG